jgi:hypothetical protein
MVEHLSSPLLNSRAPSPLPLLNSRVPKGDGGLNSRACLRILGVEYLSLLVERAYAP